MASTITKPGKQLGELLQKEQEPFVLDVFLNERGYPKKSSRKRTKGIPSCSRILRTILSKFAWNKNDESQNTKSTTTTTTTFDDQSGGKLRVNEKQRSVIGQQVAEPDRFSSASSRTVYNSCSESDCSKDESPTSLDKHDHSSFEAMRLGYKMEKEPTQAVSGGVSELRQLIGNNKQRNLVSVESPLCQERTNLRTRQELENQTKISSLILPRYISSKISNPTELARSKSSPQFVKSKRDLHQTRQLLFDCVREIVETHAKKEKVHYGKGVLGPEELGELLWEKMKAWSKQAGDETNNITYLLGLDFVDSAQEWNGFDSEKKEICSAIGDAIAEEIINEIVIEAIS